MERNVFESIKIGLASPDMIRAWSHGEVKKPETINYRTLKPERDGLYCERIFGPQKDWECLCGKYKRIRHKGKICEKCGVEVTQKKVRRERMGHIELAAPVSHIWYFRAIPSRMGLLLDISPRILEKVLYFAAYIVVDPGTSPLAKYQVLSEKELRENRAKYENTFRVGMGAQAVRELLAELDINELSEQLKKELDAANGQKKIRIIKRLEVVEAFRKSGNRPEWMILDVVPVIPPDIRPMVQLDGGRFATSDLNDLYRRVINRNSRLDRLIKLHAPDIIIRNEKRMLQEAVDALIDNGRRGKPVTGPNSRPLKSLSEMLRGKQGRFRQNLLGKRVDYSGRSVIVVGPSLKIYQCGLPKEMALELFKPFVMKRLVETGKSANIKEAKKKVEKVNPDVWDALENVIKAHPVLLNRAPTLHRLSIQAFEPVLVEGKAIKLHPLVCKAFNADFDGDQMPVHVPLSSEAQAESRFLMLSANNLLKPVDGRAIAVPSQDMVLGSYYLTINKSGEPGDTGDPDHPRFFRDYDEAEMAYENGVIGIHTPIEVRVKKIINGEEKVGRIRATFGRLIFNRHIPQDLGYVDRSIPGNEFKLEIDEDTFVSAKNPLGGVGSKQLGDIVDRCIRNHGFPTAAVVLDEIKSMGYKYSTRASISISVADITVPQEKYDIIARAEKNVDVIHGKFMRGMLTEEERYNAVVKMWNETTDSVTKALTANFNDYNPIKMMSDSGARGSMTQMRQLAGMRGLMFATNGRTIEIPIKSNFREGLSILEYFMAAKGARKSLSDTALKTADSGYLTRRLVDVAQDVIIREDDCGSREGIWVSAITVDNTEVEPLKDRLIGRYVIGDIVHPETGEILVRDNEAVTEDQAKAIVKAGIERVHIRSVLQCHSHYGVCAHCYGYDLANNKPVNVGESVGIIAAQSIGEPGTQLTMRTFHTGGVAAANITQGLPRVEELFEARKPKKTAFVAEKAGTCAIELVKKTHTITITPDDGTAELAYQIPFGTNIVVEDGQHVQAGVALTEGDKNPADILRINGIVDVYDYILLEVQKVYRSQGIDINDKHIEVIARQMTRKVKVTEEGDTGLLSGSTVNVSEFLAENEIIRIRREAGEIDLMEAKSEPLLLGITKASLQTESFLSAASFQETTKVLTEAAIKGKVDRLLALKENVLIGRLIPAGTGMDCYRNIEVDRTVPVHLAILDEEITEADREGAKNTILDTEDEDYSDEEYDEFDDSLADDSLSDDALSDPADGEEDDSDDTFEDEDFPESESFESEDDSEGE
ncbi:MAG: DNA-directed RNA polymerase subunit beta' [Ruminococcaceae bacterium]|jgi:DNA-directed RNA polymerase subunit beta'|nr:DNA-directed RNA polymerase subunit beta' [Oscillospiraceae bacterium]